MSTSIEDRLQELLDAKDADLKHLQYELDERDREVELNALRWLNHTFTELKTDKLPLPRLELVFSPRVASHGWRNYNTVESLVFQFGLHDVVCVPLSVIETSGGFDHYADMIAGNFSFMDTVHTQRRMHFLNVPGFIIVQSRIFPLEPLPPADRK